MNNELRDKIIESFKNPLRWKLMKRCEDYDYVYDSNTSITVEDLHTGMLFEINKNTYEIFCYGVYITRDSEIVKEFASMLYESRVKAINEALEFHYLGHIRTEEEKRQYVGSEFRKWKERIKKGEES